MDSIIPKCSASRKATISFQEAATVFTSARLLRKHSIVWPSHSLLSQLWLQGEEWQEARHSSWLASHLCWPDLFTPGTTYLASQALAPDSSTSDYRDGPWSHTWSHWPLHWSWRSNILQVQVYPPHGSSRYHAWNISFFQLAVWELQLLAFDVVTAR